MTFRDVRQGCTVHLLDKDAMRYSEAKVEAVGVPHFAAPQAGQAAPMGQVVDVTIGGVPYVVSCDSCVARSDKVVFATDKALLLPEVRRLKADAEAVLAGVDRARDTVSKCDGLLCELDTAFKERQEAERRMGAMEGKISKLSDMLAGFIAEMKK